MAVEDDKNQQRTPATGAKPRADPIAANLFKNFLPVMAGIIVLGLIMAWLIFRGLFRPDSQVPPAQPYGEITTPFISEGTTGTTPEPITTATNSIE